MTDKNVVHTKLDIYVFSLHISIDFMYALPAEIINT